MPISFVFDNLEFKVFENVYEPAEDSYLLAKHASGLKGKILEIGCGSGIVSLVNAKHNPKNEVLGCDLNEGAVRNAILNAEINGIKNAAFVKSNLFSGINGKFDHILFNPPYLPTKKNEKIKSELNLAFDGGSNGRMLIDLFLGQFSSYLDTKGSVLMIHSSLNNLKRTKWLLAKKGFNFEVLAEEKFFFEKLHVLKITKA